MVDYIKREDALSYLPQYPLDYSFEQTQAFMKGFIQLRKCIVGCPTADVVERKTGKWITKRTIIHDGNPYCSLCDCEPYYANDVHTLHYCPNCGARMVNYDS